jgi:hypothetical protein
MLHHLNPLKMDSFTRFTSFMYELLGVTILLLHGMYDDMSLFPSTSMHSQRIGIPPSQDLGMPILRLKEKVTHCHTSHEVGEW